MHIHATEMRVHDHLHSKLIMLYVISDLHHVLKLSLCPILNYLSMHILKSSEYVFNTMIQRNDWNGFVLYIIEDFD